MRNLALQVDMQKFTKQQIKEFLSDVNGTYICVGEAKDSGTGFIGINLHLIDSKEIEVFVHKQTKSPITKKKVDKRINKKHSWSKGSKVCYCGAVLRINRGMNTLYCPIENPGGN